MPADILTPERREHRRLMENVRQAALAAEPGEAVELAALAAAYAGGALSVRDALAAVQQLRRTQGERASCSAAEAGQPRPRQLSRSRNS